VKGNDGGGRKVHMRKTATGFAKHIAERQMDEFQAGFQPFKFSRRQSSEEMILIRLMRWGTKHPLALASEVLIEWAQSGVIVWNQKGRSGFLRNPRIPESPGTPSDSFPCFFNL
jgi:hypothetical protein